MHVATTFDHVFQCEFFSCLIVFVCEGTGKIALVVVVPLEYAWNATDEPAIRNEEAALVLSACKAALELRRLGFIPEVASHIARLEFVFTAIDVENQYIAGGFLILIESDNVADLQLRPSLEHEFLFSPHKLGNFDRAIVD